MGVELRAPFEDVCTTDRWVGRGLTGGPNDPTFDAADVGPSHQALVGLFERRIELECRAGGGPVVAARRQTDDQGVRGYGPLTDVVALVKGPHVLFVHGTSRLRGSNGAAVYELGAGDVLAVGNDGTVDGPRAVGVGSITSDAWIARNRSLDGSDGSGDESTSSSDTGDDPTTAEGPPATVTDPQGDHPLPQFDVVATTSGRLPDGRYWVLLEFAERWPVPDGTQWLARVRMHANGIGPTVAEASTAVGETATNRPEPPLEQFVANGGLLTLFPDPELENRLLYSWDVAYKAGTTEPYAFDRTNGYIRWAVDNVTDPRT